MRRLVIVNNTKVANLIICNKGGTASYLVPFYVDGIFLRSFLIKIEMESEVSGYFS